MNTVAGAAPVTVKLPKKPVGKSGSFRSPAMAVPGPIYDGSSASAPTWNTTKDVDGIIPRSRANPLIRNGDNWR